MQIFYVIALAFVSVVAADVSHLKLGLAADGAYGLTSSSSSYSSGSVVPGGDASSYQPDELIPGHLKVATIQAQSSQAITGGDSSSYQSAEHASGQLKVAAIQGESEVIPGGDSSSYQPAEYTPAHLKVASIETQSAEVIPGGDSSSYQSAHLQVQSSGAQQVLGGDSSSYAPEQFIPEADREAHYKYVQEQQQQQQQQQQQEETVIPGGDSSSYQPAEYTPAHLKVASAQVEVEATPSIGADSYTPEQFIPEADRQAHYQYVQQQQQGETVISGGDSSSYQPAEYTPAQLKVALVAPVAAAQVAPGSEESSYQTVAAPAVQYSYTQTLTKALQAPAAVAAVSYQAADLIPAYVQGQAVISKQLVAPVRQSVVYANVQGEAVSSSKQLVAPFREQTVSNGYGQSIVSEIAAPAQLYQEPVSNGIEEFNAGTHVPVAIGGNTVTPTHLQVAAPSYTSVASSSSAYSSASASSAASSSGHDTQYATNGGYVY
ncbi:POU domain, class 6, transcription factor 2 [Drosophila guanche]|uniref:Uncharacterized protein n=1 Tax=Drosophila guanche TaxID=7266 RepID=A0A3B0JXM3_DROGU|nr:POU domain, class 6, transcription factor 2 [Drosophila guanche]SPP86804.1 Hypothetical predicted protein [Drosophila guanche]